MESTPLTADADQERTSRTLPADALSGDAATLKPNDYPACTHERGGKNGASTVSSTRTLLFLSP